MDWNAIDWSALERLRDGFLSGTAAPADYWTSPAQLAAYDLTFAARIGWKWDFVLGELARRGWSPPPGAVLDWGCGTGVAARRFVHHFGPAAVPRVTLSDRSRRALDFAAGRFAAECPGVKVTLDPAAASSAANPSPSGEGGPSGPGEGLRPTDFTLVHGSAPVGTLLVSHVLSELAPVQLDALLDLAAQCAAVIWVEPGSFDSSRSLITSVRERLRDRFTIKAPCTHQESCGLLVPENARHWCHQFAASPPEIYQDANWSRFARTVGVDLRSLPLSFLVLDRRTEAAPLPENALRLLGRPRMEKARALLFGCDRSGVRDRRFLKRRDGAAFRLARHGDLATLLLCRQDGDEIMELAPAVADSQA